MYNRTFAEASVSRCSVLSHLLSQPPGAPRVFDVPQRLAAALAALHHHVEPVLIPGSATLENPGPGDPLQHPALLGADGLLAGATAIGAPRLDLDEGHQVTTAGNQVEVVPTQAIAVRLDAPALPHQPAASSNLRVPPVTAARVGPIGWRKPGHGHAGRMAEHR